MFEKHSYSILRFCRKLTLEVDQEIWCWSPSRVDSGKIVRVDEEQSRNKKGSL